MLLARVEQQDDLALFQLLQKGNRAAFNTLFLKYYNRLCQFAVLRLKNRMDAEEVVSDVFFYIYSQRDRITIQQNVRAYLYIATRNACLAFAKKQTSQVRWLNEEAAGTTPAAGNPESIMEWDERQQIIEASIDKLPERAREVFLLSRNEGLSYTEIATVLDISERTVESHISQALHLLCGQLLNRPTQRVTSDNKPVTI